MKYFFPVLSLLIFCTFFFSNAYAHTDIVIGNYDVKVGWGDEPPVVGFRNFIVFEIIEKNEGKGVKNAFQDLKATAKFGGVTKDLDIISEVQSGHYSSKIIPTATGTISIELRGNIDEFPVDIQIPIEDVEDTAILDFPPTTGSSSDQDIVSVKLALSSIQKDLSDLKNRAGTDLHKSNLDPQTAFVFGIVGILTGVSGVVLAVFKIIKKEKGSKP